MSVYICFFFGFLLKTNNNFSSSEALMVFLVLFRVDLLIRGTDDHRIFVRCSLKWNGGFFIIRGTDGMKYILNNFLLFSFYWILINIKDTGCLGGLGIKALLNISLTVWTPKFFLYIFFLPQAWWVFSHQRNWWSYNFCGFFLKYK